MGILFASSNAQGFASGNAITYSEAARARQAGYTNQEFALDNATGGTITSTAQVPALTPAGDDLWVHFRAYFPPNFTNSTASDGHMLLLRDASENVIARLDVEDGRIRAAAFTDAGVATYGSLFTVSPNVAYTIDLHLNCDGATHTLDLFVDGSLVSSASTSGTRPVATDLLFETNDMAGYNSPNTYIYCAELIVDDTNSTVGTRLVEMQPASDGDYTEFTGSYADLVTFGDEAVATGAVGERLSWNPSAYGGPNSGEFVRAVTLQTNVITGSEGPTGFTPFLRTASTDYFGANATVGVSVPGAQTQVWGVNPNTGLDWTVAELAAVQFGIRADA